MILTLLAAGGILEATTVSPAPGESVYFAYSKLPGEGGNAGGIASGIGDTDDIPLKRTAFVISFATNDSWRTAAAQEDAVITLNLEISSIQNNGAPSDITLTLLDVGRDLSSTNSPYFAWLLAPTLYNYGEIIVPDAIGVMQVFDVTEKIKENIQNLNYQDSAICFGFYTPIPSDNGVENTSFITTTTASLKVSTGSINSTEVEIQSAIFIEFDTTPGYSYFIEYSSNLSQWTRETTGIEGNGESHRNFYPVSEDRKFYRVVTIE